MCFLSLFQSSVSIVLMIHIIILPTTLRRYPLAQRWDLHKNPERKAMGSYWHSYQSFPKTKLISLPKKEKITVIFQQCSSVSSLSNFRESNLIWRPGNFGHLSYSQKCQLRGNSKKGPKPQIRPQKSGHEFLKCAQFFLRESCWFCYRISWTSVASTSFNHSISSRGHEIWHII